MALTWSVDFSGNPDRSDRDAAQWLIDNENARRAAMDPPLSPLPSGNGAELKASYLAVLTETINSTHASYIQQAAEKTQQDVRELWRNASEVQRQAAITALGG